MNHFEKVKNMIIELGYNIANEDAQQNFLKIDNPEQGIHNATILVEEPVVIIEQFIVKIAKPSLETYASILQKNRQLVHGAFVLADSTDKMIFRDTLQVDNLDLNEIEASLNSIALGLAENADFIKSIA